MHFWSKFNLQTFDLGDSMCKILITLCHELYVLSQCEVVKRKIFFYLHSALIY
jgi:hypothetical protein